jgi:hypothetical protein
MNEVELKLKLVETFATTVPYTVDVSEEICVELESALMPAITNQLREAIESERTSFMLTFSEFKYAHPSKTTTKMWGIPYRLEKEHWFAYVPRIKYRLMQAGIPFVLSEHYPSYKKTPMYPDQSFIFYVDELKKFCDADKSGMLL